MDPTAGPASAALPDRSPSSPESSEAPAGASEAPAGAAAPADADVLRADPRYRLVVAGVALAGLALGGLAIVLFRRRMVSLYVLAVEDSEAAVAAFFQLAGWIFLGFGVLVTLVGLHAFVTARRAFRAAQMPPPGTRVLRDTPVVRGPLARRRARTAMILAGLIVLVGILTPFLGAYVLPRIATADDASAAAP